LLSGLGGGFVARPTSRASAAIVMMMAVPAVKHDSVVTVMPVSSTDVNTDAADPDVDAFRDNHWFVASIRRTGKCRQRQKRNNKQGKQSILHGTLLG
jgi:hypothetical protein